MQSFAHYSTVGHRVQDHLDQQEIFRPELANLYTSNPPGPSGAIMNRSPGIREHRDGRRGPGTNFEIGSTENRQSSRHGLSNTIASQITSNVNQTPRKSSQDHLMTPIERSDSEASIFGNINCDTTANMWNGDSSPLNTYLHHQADQLCIPTGLQQSFLGGRQELAGVGEEPGNYIARTSRTTPPALHLSPPGDFYASSGAGLDRYFSPTSSSYGDMLGISSPLTPKSETLTMGSSLQSDMSRQSSWVGGIGMMRINSSISDYSPNAFAPHSDASVVFPQITNDEQSMWLTGAGGAGLIRSSSGNVSPETVEKFDTKDFFIEDMERSQSNDSNISGGSTSSRSKQQLQRQIQHAARPIAPKQEDDLIISRQSSISSFTNSSQSNNVIKDRAVTAIPKMPYQRPKHERVFCKKCEEHQDGFRGEHELRRHQDRQHKPVVKKFICVEPKSLNRSPDDPTPMVPLSKCKACLQKKRYGAYYNAAAHLRRAHFRPRPKGRTKGSRIEDKPLKRGGKGGGDWPSMDQLKKWMQDVDEMMEDNQITSIVGDDSDVEGAMEFDNATINFNSNLYFDNVSAQNKPIFRYDTQLNAEQDGFQPSLHNKSASGQTHFNMRHMPLNMHQSFFDPAKGLEPTLAYCNSHEFMDVSSYIDSFDNGLGVLLQDTEFSDLPNHFM